MVLLRVQNAEIANTFTLLSLDGKRGALILYISACYPIIIVADGFNRWDDYSFKPTALIVW